MSDLSRTSSACSSVREAISAHLDGEPAAVDADAVSRHLDGCAACQRFEAALPGINRRVTVGTAEAVPDLTAPIIVALAADRDTVGDRRVRDLRVLVGLAGIVHLVLALPVLIGVAGPLAHAGRELAAFELALGAGLLFAAWQPDRAAGVLPVAAVAAVIATVTGLADLAAGQATVLGELTHLTELLAVLALWALTRRLPDRAPLLPAGAA